MAIIVDKVKKREAIACSCKELLLKEGFNAITISKITKTAGISKGSFYDYFENKEDLVFEILSHLMKDYNKKLEAKLANSKNVKDKIKELTAFFYEDEYSELREIYKQFAAISLLESNSAIASFQFKNHNFYKEWVIKIMQQAIKNNELKQEALDLVEGLFATIKGFFISYSIMGIEEKLKEQIDNYLDNIFKYLEENR